MRYLVPQFIKREIKILGPMSFRQVLFAGAGVGICAVLYFLLVPEYIIVFLFLSLIIMGASVALAFGKYQGLSLAKVVVNFISHLLGGRQYLWKKKAVISQTYSPPKMKEPEEKEETSPVTRKSRLENLSSRLDTYREES